MTFEDILREAKKVQDSPFTEGQHRQIADLLNQSFWKADGQSIPPRTSPPPKAQKTPHWSSLDQMMRDLNSLPKNPPKAAGPPPDPEARRKAINDELDIIRGRVPTPQGYVVNPARAKALMAELKKLS